MTFAGSPARGARDPSALKQSFAVDATSPLATGGCQVQDKGGDLICAGSGAQIGAVLPDGSWFDLELPFQFPFYEVLRRVAQP